MSVWACLLASLGCVVWVLSLFSLLNIMMRSSPAFFEKKAIKEDLLHYIGSPL